MKADKISQSGWWWRGGGDLTYPTPCWFSLNNSEEVKTITQHFAIFSNFLLETSVPNFVSLTCSSL